MSPPSQAARDRIVELLTRGNALAGKGQYRDAIKCYDRILAIAPDIIDVINNRSNCLAMLGQNEQAVAGYDRILAARPDDIRARSNRASALKELGRYREALGDYDLVLAREPGYTDALYNQGNALADLGRPLEAITSYRRALALAPNDRDIACSLIFALNFDEVATTASLQAERSAWAAQFDGLAATSHPNDPDPDRRLRVGYVSAHFRRQAATYAFGGVLTQHDRQQFEVFCYSDTAPEDDVTHRLRRHAESWRRTLDLSDEQIAAQVRADRIDILVDLVGHMKGHRLGVFARKPAPIQVSGWGEPTGTGLKAMDYVFADPVTVPPDERPLLIEQVADLPNFIGFWSPEPLPAPRPPPSRHRGHVTFGSFNRFSKVVPGVLQAWAAILRAVPGSRLLLKDRLRDQARASDPILADLAREGVAADRVTILPQGNRASHFAAYHDIDIALDPFPHGGG